MKQAKKFLIVIGLSSSLSSQAGDFGEAFGRALGEIAFRLLMDSVAYALTTPAGRKQAHQDTMNTSSSSTRKKIRPRLLTEEGKKVNFLYSVKFVMNPAEVESCKLQKTVYHRSYFPWLVEYPEMEHMHLWFNNQTLKEEALNNLSNVVLIKGQEKNPIRVKQEADLYSCPTLRPISMSSCHWLKTHKVKIPSKNLLANKNTTIRMMNHAAKLGGNHIAFIKRTGKSAMGMQKFSYEIFDCGKM